MFPDCPEMREKIDDLILKKREIWPWPGPEDGLDSDYTVRRFVCNAANWKRWIEKKDKTESSKKPWTLYNAIVPQTSTTEDMPPTTDPENEESEEEEEDEV